MLTIQEILHFISEDKASEKKQFAKKGAAYYDGDHDIRQYKLYYFNADGNLVEDKTRSNIKIPHPFFTELVDQAVQYILSGKDGFVKSDVPELQTELDDYFNYNEDFLAELSEAVTGAKSKGFEYMYAYINSEGRISFECADSMGVVEVRAKYTEANCDHVIYWYVDRIAKNNKKIKRIQVWDAEQTYYYVQGEDETLELDTDVEFNPKPHTIYKKENDEATYYESFGFIPFFRLDNNKKQFSDLKSIKELIDDYDLMSCGLSNNIQDASEYLVVVKGFQGDGLEELIKNIKTKKHIGVDGDDGGDVDFKTVEIPYEARKTKLELDEKNIYRFGMGLNTAGLKDTNATTNIAIKAAYSLLDLKATKFESRLKQFLRKIVKVVLKEINETNGTDYQSKDVYFEFEHEIMSNAVENAQIELTEAQTEQAKVNTLLSLAAQLGNDLMVEQICDCLDIDYSEIKDKLPDPEDDALNSMASAQQKIDDITIEETEPSAEKTIEKTEESIGKALNGAQTASLLTIISQYKAGQLTPDEAVSIISISIGISEEKARKILRL